MSTVEKANFDAMRDITVTPGPEMATSQLRFVASSLDAQTPTEVRRVVHDYIDQEITNPDTRQAAFATLTFATQEGLQYMDEHLSMNHEQFMLFQQQLKQLPSDKRMPLEKDFQARVEASRQQIAENNHQRIGEILGLASKFNQEALEPMDEETAWLAYKAVAAAQDKLYETGHYFNGRRREDEKELPGVEITEEMLVQLQDSAVALLEHVHPEKMAQAYEQQAFYALDPAKKQVFLEQSLRWIRFDTGNPVTKSLRVAELAERMDLQEVWEQALTAALGWVGAQPKDITPPKNPNAPFNAPLPRKEVMWALPATAVSPDNPHFKQAMSSITAFSKEQAFNLLNDPSGVGQDFLVELATGTTKHKLGDAHLLKVLPTRETRMNLWDAVVGRITDEAIVENTRYTKTYSPTTLITVNAALQHLATLGPSPTLDRTGAEDFSKIIEKNKKKLRDFLLIAKPVEN